MTNLGVTNKSPRYLHGIQKDVLESTDLSITIPAQNQLTFIDDHTVYSDETVYGREYVISADSGPDRTDEIIGLIDDLEQNTHKYHGLFYDKDTGAYEISLSYSAANRTLTITPTSGIFRVWHDGVMKLVYGVQTISHAATEGGWFFYYDENFALNASQTPWSILADIPVAFVYYDATTPEGLLLDERHHHESSKEWHNSQHFALGTFVKRSTDFAIADYTPGVSSDAAVTWSLASGTIVDEDINTAVSAVADGGPYQTWYKTGASGAWRRIQRTLPYHFNGTTNWIQYNQLTGGAWQLTDIGNNEFVNYYIFAVPALDTTRQILCVPGQTKFGSLSAAQADSASGLDLSNFPSQEFVAMWKITFRADTGGGSTGRATLVEVTKLLGSRGSSTTSGTAPTIHNSLSGRSDADTHPATSITNTPAGNIAATTAQAAINELDSEKGGLALNNTWTGTNYFNNSTASTSTTTGAVTVAGGVGIGGRINAGDSIGTVGSVNSDTGIFRAGVASNTTNSTFRAINAGGTFYLGIDNSAGSGFGGVPYELVLFGETTTPMSFWTSSTKRVQVEASGEFKVLSSTASTSTTTGALVVAGGVGIGGYINCSRVSGISSINNDVILNFANTNSNGYGGWIQGGNDTKYALTVSNYQGVEKVVVLGSGDTKFNSATASTSTTTGALVVTGGVGIGGKLYVGGDASISNTTTCELVLTATGTTSDGSNTNKIGSFKPGVGYNNLHFDAASYLFKVIGTYDAISIDNLGNVKFQQKTGFNNSTPISKPTITGSRGGNAALANLLTQLANYGLITDSTSA